ncbi:MAG: TIGR02452 family protein [Acetobacter sp.]|nr:TIGR02452 family protein [Acetobacter sp.]
MRDYSAKHARAWIEEVKNRMSEDTKNSILGTKIYDSLVPSSTCSLTQTTLLPMDTVSALFEEDWPGKVCILNFASYNNPGGGFLKGMTTQEEALCHESNLYLILLAFKGSYYAWNRQHNNHSLYLDRALYSPDVIFERDGKQKRADVLTCAAPNWDNAKIYGNVSEEDNREVVFDRLAFMSSILADNDVTTFICGAWGCGVFGQDPKMMANAMIDSMLTPRVVWAIPRGYNYDMFKEASR